MVKEVVTRVDQIVISLTGRLPSNIWLQDRVSAATIFPLITAAEGTHDIHIETITLVGSAEENEEINGNYALGVFIQCYDRWSFSHVTSRDYNRDGFSF